MRQLKSILLLIIIGITILPWQMVCAEHPFGEPHHEHHDGPSPCELRRIALQRPGDHLLPPMDCGRISKATDNYNQVQVEKIVPTFHLVAVLAVVFNLVDFKVKDQHSLIPPDPNCRSATLLSDSPLRAPPLV